MLTVLQLVCFFKVKSALCPRVCLLWSAVKGCLTAVFAFAPVFGIRVRKENSLSLLHALHVHGLHYLKRAAIQLQTTDETDLVNNRKTHKALSVRLQFTECTSEFVRALFLWAHVKKICKRKCCILSKENSLLRPRNVSQCLLLSIYTYNNSPSRSVVGICSCSDLCSVCWQTSADLLSVCRSHSQHLCFMHAR